MNEPQIEHLVGLVEHQKACRVKAQRAPVDEVEKPPRRGDKNIAAPVHPVDLCADRGAANHKVDADGAVLDQRHERVADLPRQLARRRKDEAAHGFGCGSLGIGHQPRHQRQAKGQRLAGAGLRQTHHVIAVKRVRDRTGLDRRRLGDAKCCQLAGQRLGQAHRVEKSQIKSFQAPGPCPHTRDRGCTMGKAGPHAHTLRPVSGPTRDFGNRSATFHPERHMMAGLLTRQEISVGCHMAARHGEVKHCGTLW